MDEKSRKIWNKKEIAEFLGRSPDAIRNLILRRKIPYRKLAGCLVFSVTRLKNG